MSRFITNLSFTDVRSIIDAKISILVASAIASILGYGVLRFAKTPERNMAKVPC